MAKTVNIQTKTVTSVTSATINNNTAKLPADGIPAKANQVLCPAVFSINEWPSLDTIIRENLEQFTCCGQTFYIGYVATDIPNGQTAAEVYNTCNKEKNKFINEYLNARDTKHQSFRAYDKEPQAYLGRKSF